MRRARRAGDRHPDLTAFRLAQEFGWTPAELRAQRATDVEKFVLILEELERLSALVAEDDGGMTILISDD